MTTTVHPITRPEIICDAVRDNVAARLNAVRRDFKANQLFLWFGNAAFVPSKQHGNFAPACREVNKLSMA